MENHAENSRFMKLSYQNIILTQIIARAEEERPTKHLMIKTPRSSERTSITYQLLQKIGFKTAPPQKYEMKTYSRIANHWSFLSHGYKFVCLCQKNKQLTLFNLNVYKLGKMVSSLSLEMNEQNEKINLDFVDHFELLEDIAIDFGLEAIKRKKERMICSYISSQKRDMANS
jgi:hypothetical protein